MKGKDSSVFPGCRIPAQVPLTFLSALFSGMLAHGMGLWNKLSWHDDIQALFWEGSTISSGRWMLHVLGWLEKLFFESGHFSLPAFNGLFALCMLAAAAAALVHLLKIRRKVCCMGLGCLMAVFPTVTALLGYMFTIHYYMLAMVMIVVSTCLICGKRRWWGKAFAVLPGGCSLGIYQAFFPLMPGILLIWNMDRRGDRKEKNSDFLKQTVT
ncbi:MAG: glucosyltransferase domain-containing protein, partial [Clostridia bacterium]|nr:glucosyltransferase domain-containing protein [Clostridia bacterium]